jgi:hypothetical protein
VRKVWQRHENDGALLLDLIQLDTELANLLRSLAIGVEDGARVFALPLRSRNLVARRILIALQPFEIGNETPPPILECRQLLELSVGIDAAAVESTSYLFAVIAYVCRIKHCEIVCD